MPDASALRAPLVALPFSTHHRRARDAAISSVVLALSRSRWNAPRCRSRACAARLWATATTPGFEDRNTKH
jgi:hypothetical protein